MNLDVKTLFYVFSFGGFVTLWVFLLYAKFFKVHLSSFVIYAIAKFLQATAFLLFANRNSFSSDFVIFLTNSVLLFGLAFEIYSLSSVNQKFNVKRFLYQIAGASILSLLFLYSLQFSANTRVAIMSFILTTCFFHGYLLVQKQKSTKMQHIIAVILLFTSLSMLVRGINAVWFNENMSLFTAGIIPVLTYIVFFFIALIA